MRLLLIISLLTFSASAEIPFPEAELKKWGYKVTKVDAEKKRYQIRSLKNFGSSSVKFYARYGIWKETFASKAEASERKKEFENRTDEVSFKDYTEILQKGNTLYFFGATSNRIRYEDQPRLRKLILEYLEKQPTRD